MMEEKEDGEEGGDRRWREDMMEDDGDKHPSQHEAKEC